MITIEHHSTVQGILDEWRRSLTMSDKAAGHSQCSAEDLRRLIALLEDALDGMAEQLDRTNDLSVRALLLTNWNWIRNRLKAIHIRFGQRRDQ